MYFVYIIESELDGSYYFGQTFDLEARIRRHNSGKNKYTVKKRPWKLKMWKEVDTRSEAVYYERRLKGLKKREKIIEFGRKNEFRGVAQPGPDKSQIFNLLICRGSTKNKENLTCLQAG